MIASILQIQSKKWKADIYLSALGNHLKFFGENHLQVAKDYFLLGVLYYEIKDLESALKNLHFSYEIGTKILEINHSKVRNTLFWIEKIEKE